MSVDRKALQRDALKFVQQGKIDKAIEAYRAVVKDDPKDSKTRNTLGDLYTRQGRRKEAIAEYQEVANLYEKDGFALRAIAICQKIVNLDPELVAVRQRLGDLYAGQKLATEAREQYLWVANYHDKKGEVAAALEIFRKIADLDPDNLPVRVKLAGMFERQNFPEKAAEELVRAAKGYAAAGQAASAVDLYQRAIKLHPAGVAARRGLAEHHAARKEWAAVVQALAPVVAREVRDSGLVILYAEASLHLNRAADAVAALGKVQEREPNSVPVNLVLGRALVAIGEVEQGIAALNRCVGAHLAENRFELAETLLREMAANAPDDDRIQQRILDVAQRRGDQGAVAQAYLRLAAIFEKKGLARNAIGALEMFVGLHPEDAAAATRLAALRGQAPRPAPPAPPPPAPPPPPPPPPPIEDDEDVVEIDLEGADFELPGIGTETGEEFEIAVEGEEPAAAPPAVLRTLDDVAACLHGGACERAAVFLETWITEHPGDLEAARLLCDARRTQGNRPALRDALLRYAELHRGAGRFEEARSAYKEALDVDPRSAAAAVALAEVVVEEERLTRAAAAPPEPLPLPSPEIVSVPEPEPVSEPEPVPEPEPLFEPVSAPEPEPSPEPVFTPEPAAEAGFSPPAGMFESDADEISLELFEEELAPAPPAAVAAGPPAGEPPPPEPAAAPPAEDADAPQFWGMDDLLAPAARTPAPEPQVEEVALEGFEDFLVETPASEPGAAPAKVAIPETGTGSGELEEFLAEANFYFQQGLLDEAEFLYHKLLKLAPGNAEIAGQLHRLEESRREAPPPPPPPPRLPVPPAPPPAPAPPEPAAGESDFADFLSDLRHELETEVAPVAALEPEPQPEQQGEEGLSEIFHEFQRSVKEQLGEEDFETHYNLGIAYKEMGLLDEALGEFGLAERSPARRMDAVSMIALCLREMGRHDDAARKLDQGISFAAPGSEEQKGFLYDLAALREETGRTADAQEALRRIFAHDPGYRDVAQRLKAPVAAAGPAPAPPPPAPGPAAPEPAAPRRKPKVSYL